MDFQHYPNNQTYNIFTIGMLRLLTWFSFIVKMRHLLVDGWLVIYLFA